MRPTRWQVLGALAALTAVASWGVLRVVESRGGSAPGVPWTAPAALLLLAAAVFVSARAMRRRRAGAPGARPVDPIAAARLVVLAKAASHGGSVAAGYYLGLVVVLLRDVSLGTRAQRALVSGAGVLSCAALVAAGLVLERACRVDRPPGLRGDGERTHEDDLL